MGVHIDSVIPAWVNDYYPDFYVSLTDKEEYTYDNAAPIDKPRWEAQFGELRDKLNWWKDNNGAGGAVRNVRDFILATHSYRLIHVLYGTSYNQANNDAYYVFSMNDFISQTLSRPVSYYDDLAETPSSSGIWISAKIQADISTIDGYVALENSRKEAIESTSRGISSSIVVTAIFEDIPQAGAPSKQDMGEFIFYDLHYKNLADVASINVPVPSYIV